MWVLLVFSVAMLGYVYVGYPLLLRLLVRLRRPRPVQRAEITPPVSFVISAYNEAEVIARKLENTLSLDYPADRMEIVVISDASSDATDEIVGRFADRGVKLARQAERRGKTGGLNRVLPLLQGEIVVFSDANASYEHDAVRKLTRNFADPSVGCVTGEARYLVGDRAAADAGERAYWDYEIQIKKLETAIGSMVGGDGAIYAIRRHLWRELPEDGINDFLNPLQIVAAGWRNVYDPEAVCYEETAGGVGSEYRRRVRIVSRSWRAVFQAGNVLNPFRVGLFAWCLLSHKVLRWLSGLFLALAAAGGVGMLISALLAWPLVTMLTAGITAAALGSTRRGRRVVAIGGYFLVINAASVVGLVKGTLGQVSGVWTTPRQPAPGTATRPRYLIPAGVIVQVSVVLAIVIIGITWTILSSRSVAILLFWASAVMLIYIYAGYPAVIALLRVIARHPTTRANIEPRVTLFIAANDESAVIEAKLRNTLALDYPERQLEIVVASDGSIDETNAIVRKFAPRVRLLEFSPRRGKIAVINDGMREVTSEIVVFSDANTFLERGAVRALVRTFGDEHVGAASGDVRLEGERAALAQSEDLYYEYERWVQAAESDIGSMVGVDGALYAIRRRLFCAPAADTILDDMAIPMAVIRAGYRVVYEPTAKGHERGSESATEEFARKSRVIAGAVQFLSRSDSTIPIGAKQVAFSLVSHKALRWLSPAFGATTFAASLALAPTGLIYALAAILQSALVVLGLTGCYRPLRRTAIIGLAHYFCLVQAAAAVGFLRGLSRSQSVRWRRFSRMPVQMAR